MVKMVNNLQSGKIKAAQFREVLNALWEAIVLDTTPRSKFQNMASEKIEYLSTLEDFQNADPCMVENIPDSNYMGAPYAPPDFILPTPRTRPV